LQIEAASAIRKLAAYEKKKARRISSSALLRFQIFLPVKVTSLF